MKDYGFIRVAAVSPKIKVADTGFNLESAKEAISKAEQMQVSLLTFPELSLTGYTCGDLFGTEPLRQGAMDALRSLVEYSSGKKVCVVAGAPLRICGRLYDCAAVIRDGHLLGLVPKVHIPDYDEACECRWFRSGKDFLGSENPGGFLFDGVPVPVSPNLLFEMGEAVFGIEIGEDALTPAPPSSFLAAEGANVILNLSAKSEILLRHRYRKGLAWERSARTLSAYVYCSSGFGESTQDLVFAGSSVIYESGDLIAESERFSLDSVMTVADLDVRRLTALRAKRNTFDFITPGGTDSASAAAMFSFVDAGDPAPTDFEKQLLRDVDPHPFVPSGDAAEVASRCRDILSIQVLGLVTRLSHIGAKKAVLGISGGLDSTLALIVTVMAFDRLGLPRSGVIGITMPGQGTSRRTKSNATSLMESLGITTLTIPIVDAVEGHFRDIGHDPSLKDTTYENAQARERTQILMDYANKCGGLVIGTGDLSELALGWCTYNGDHMSMYGVNGSVPKTLVRYLCRWAGENVFRKEESILKDIADTPISPELIPADASGKITQMTEALVGPYELTDFFLYHFFRYGCEAPKLLFLAKKAFGDAYAEETLKTRLKDFLRRFFSQQFKRSCLPDGPKVGSVSLSPRGDWKMPSDASAADFLKDL